MHHVLTSRLAGLFLIQLMITTAFNFGSLRKMNKAAQVLTRRAATAFKVAPTTLSPRFILNPALFQNVTAAPAIRPISTSVSGAEIKAHFSHVDLEGQNVADAMEALAKADAVCFDVDSTVIQEEGIDVLADSLGKGAEVAAWTKKAMDGDTKFEDALAARLDIIQPSRESILKCLKDHPLVLSPGVDRLVKALKENGTDVYLVSGGFRVMIEPVAETLEICKSNIVANTIFFDEATETGEYAGFCRDEPTSADMGKPKAVQMIKDKHGYDTVVMVGDGATDAQAKPPADAFVGFGGVAVRDAVRAKACWYVHDFKSMIDVVEKFGTNMKKKRKCI